MVRRLATNWVCIFKRMNVTFSTTSKVVTIIIWLRNISSTKISYSHQMFTSQFFSINSIISCPWSTITTKVDFGLIEFAPLSEWKWSYRTSNRARLDLNKRWAPPLPTSGGLQQRWRQSCFDEASKMDNSVIDGCDTHFAKTLIFFRVFTLQACSVGSYQRFATFFSRSKGQKQAP